MGDQFVVGAGGDAAAVLEEVDRVADADGAEAVRDHDDGLGVGEVADRVHDGALGAVVERTGGRQAARRLSGFGAVNERLQQGVSPNRRAATLFLRGLGKRPALGKDPSIGFLRRCFRNDSRTFLYRAQRYEQPSHAFRQCRMPDNLYRLKYFCVAP